MIYCCFFFVCLFISQQVIAGETGRVVCVNRKKNVIIMITYIFELFRTPFPHKKETLTVTAFFSLLVYVYIFIE